MTIGQVNNIASGGTVQPWVLEQEFFVLVKYPVSARFLNTYILVELTRVSSNFGHTPHC